jgi:hypothetical protein
MSAPRQRADIEERMLHDIRAALHQAGTSERWLAVSVEAVERLDYGAGGRSSPVVAVAAVWPRSTMGTPWSVSCEAYRLLAALGELAALPEPYGDEQIEETVRRCAGMPARQEARSA